jgi:hypothetical protein
MSWWVKAEFDEISKLRKPVPRRRPRPRPKWSLLNSRNVVVQGVGHRAIVFRRRLRMFYIWFNWISVPIGKAFVCLAVFGAGRSVGVMAALVWWRFSSTVVIRLRNQPRRSAHDQFIRACGLNEWQLKKRRISAIGSLSILLKNCSSFQTALLSFSSVPRLQLCRLLTNLLNHATIPTTFQKILSSPRPWAITSMTTTRD